MRRLYCTFISLSVAAVDIGMLIIPSESLLVYPTFSGSQFRFSLRFHLGASSCLGDVSRLGDGCGTLRLGGTGVNWGSQARKGGG